MNKFTKAITALARIARNPWLLNKILDDESKWKQYVVNKYQLVMGLPVVEPPVLFGDFNEIIYPFASLDGSSLPTDLALLKKFARSFDHCSYFEIGTWRGESVANVASVAMECYTLNLDAQQMGNMGMNEKYIGLHRYFSAQLGNVTHLQGDSRAYDFSSIDRKFDLIFIDGDHRYEFVKNDTEQVFKHLFHENSIVVWHDYAYNPEKLRFEVLAGILDGCPAKFHGQLYYVANTMCAVYVNRDLDTHEFESPKTPEGAFEIKIDWKD